MQASKKVVDQLGVVDGSVPFKSGNSRYVAGVTVPLFGHAGHTVFRCSSTSYVDVPDTYSAASTSGRGKFKIAISFATMHDKSLSLRMFDPANPDFAPVWEFNFVGGHASNKWWSFLVTPEFSPFDGEPWPRQNTLQIKSDDGSEVLLGSVNLIVTQ